MIAEAAIKGLSINGRKMSLRDSDFIAVMLHSKAKKKNGAVLMSPLRIDSVLKVGATELGSLRASGF